MSYKCAVLGAGQEHHLNKGFLCWTVGWSQQGHLPDFRGKDVHKIQGGLFLLLSMDPYSMQALSPEGVKGRRGNSICITCPEIISEGCHLLNPTRQMLL